MAKNLIISEKEIQEVFYRNAKVTKVHEDDVYDVKFSTGKIRTYVENTSSLKFNSGDYVAVLLSGETGRSICKILGKGRRINETSSIPVVRV